MLSVFLAFFVSAAALAAAPGVLGYGSSTAVLPAKTLENFTMGFELGFDRTLGRERAKKSLLRRDDTEGGAMAALRSAEALLRSGAVALVGFPGSHDSLLVADLARERNLLALFLGSGHSALADKGPTVFSTGLSMPEAAPGMLTALRARFRGKTGLVVINPLSVYSTNYDDVLRTEARKAANAAIALEFAYLDKRKELPAEVMEKLRAGRYAFLVPTPYAEETVPMMDQLVRGNIDLPMLTASWSTASPEIMRRFLVSYRSPIFIATEWQRGADSSRPFEARYRERYGREPESEAAFGYDLGVIAGTLVLRTKGPLTRESVLAAFHGNRCFDGLTAGRLCFPAGGGFPSRKLWLVRYTKTGTVPEKLE